MQCTLAPCVPALMGGGARREEEIDALTSSPKKQVSLKTITGFQYVLFPVLSNVCSRQWLYYHELLVCTEDKASHRYETFLQYLFKLIYLFASYVRSRNCSAKTAQPE